MGHPDREPDLESRKVVPPLELPVNKVESRFVSTLPEIPVGGEQIRVLLRTGLHPEAHPGEASTSSTTRRPAS